MDVLQHPQAPAPPFVWGFCYGHQSGFPQLFSYPQFLLMSLWKNRYTLCLQGFLVSQHDFSTLPDRWKPFITRDAQFETTEIQAMLDFLVVGQTCDLKSLQNLLPLPLQDQKHRFGPLPPEDSIGLPC